MKKTCLRCGLSGPAVSFSIKSTKSLVYCDICRPIAEEEQAHKDRQNEKNKERARQRMRSWRAALRYRVIKAYGARCTCCGERGIEFLALDHVEGGGSQHRRDVGGSNDAVYADAERRGYPDDFQLHCHNCNLAKHHYGVCPHQSGVWVGLDDLAIAGLKHLHRVVGKQPLGNVKKVLYVTRRKVGVMAELVTDPTDPRLGHGIDKEPRAQHDVYLVLSEEERKKGFVRPLRRSYTHVAGEHPCHTSTRMGLELCETYARDPSFYGATYCVGCGKHLKVAEFIWDEDGEKVGE